MTSPDSASISLPPIVVNLPLEPPRRNVWTPVTITAEHMRVETVTGQLVTTIPHTLHGTGTGFEIVKKLIEAAF